jgi:hypothetical protein
MNRFIGHSQAITTNTNNYNILKITATITHIQRLLASRCLATKSYLVNTSQLNSQLLKCLLNSLTNELRLNLSRLKSPGMNSQLTLSQSHIATDGQSIFYCLIFQTSLFVASYDSQGYGGGIRPPLHTGDCWC